MAGVKTGAGPLAVPGPGKVSGADLEGLGPAEGALSSQPLAGFRIGALANALPLLCLPQPMLHHPDTLLKSVQKHWSGA